MNPRLVDALETCIQTIQSGGSVEECLRVYPDLASELNSMVKAAKSLADLKVGDAPVEAIQTSRREFLALAKQFTSQDSTRNGTTYLDKLLQPLKKINTHLPHINALMRRISLALGIATLLILFSGGLLMTSAKSLPGDSLYPVKIAVENIKVHLAASDEARRGYEADYSQQRVTEIRKLLEMERVRKISFEGTLSSISNSQWVVSGIPVEIQSSTANLTSLGEVGSADLGMEVEVEGMTSTQGWVVADEIHLREYRYLGTVENMDRTSWLISGIAVRITSGTTIGPGIQLGDAVVVLIRSEDNGLFAEAIKLNSLINRGGTPAQPSPSTPDITDESGTDENEELTLSGVVEKISSDDWTVDGVNVHITGETEIPENVKVGDRVTIIYKVEGDGSITAIEIEESGPSDHQDDGEEQRTPEPDSDAEGRSVVTQSPSQGEETEEVSHDYEHEGTPEATESP